MGCGFSGEGGRGILRHLLYFALAGEWGEFPHFLHPRSVAAVFRRYGQTDELSSPSVPVKAVGHLAVVCVSSPERVFGVMCTYACVCPQSSVALGLHWGQVSSWLPACGQLWEQRGSQVGPWFGKVCTLHCILILHL